MGVRSFIAIEMDDAVRGALGKVQQQIKGKLAKRVNMTGGIKWTRAEQIHLTLKFLGDIEDQEIRDICQAMDEAAAAVEPFDLAIDCLGSFPEGKPARIVWAGMSEGSDALRGLFGRLEEALEILGFPREKRAFQGHLTLARVTNVRIGREMRHLAEETSMLEQQQGVDGMVLMQSELTRQGPIYRPMYHCGLG